MSSLFADFHIYRDIIESLLQRIFISFYYFMIRDPDQSYLFLEKKEFLSLANFFLHKINFNKFLNISK
jgi:hypothetical protein